MTASGIAPLLGFGIPVYNRPKLLDLALASLVPEAELIDAPIYISDNSCGPTNVEVVARWHARYSRIEHVINDTNIGIDANVDRAISSCPADYVLVIGDDDIVFPGLALGLHELLAAKRPVHALCPYIYLDNIHRPISGLPVVPPETDGQPFARILAEYGWALGFIGTHVFHRARYRACPDEAMGSYFNHLAKLIAYVGPSDPVPVAGRPLVGNRADDESTPTWSGDRLNVLFGLERVMRRSMTGRYPPGDIESAIARTRERLGYAQPLRLLYWAALAESSGRGEAYWGSLKALVPEQRYRSLRLVPRTVTAILLLLFPMLRRLKRRLAQRATRSKLPPVAGPKQRSAQ